MVKKRKTDPTSKHPLVQKKIEKSLERSVKEGSYAAAMTGFGSSYLSPYALALNATSSQMGILNALINFLPGLIQLKASHLIERFSRKRLVIIPALLQALMFIPIILAGLLFYFNVPHVSWILICFVALFYSLGALANPAWFSWMGSLVPDNERGKYFSKRNRVVGFFGLITMVIGAIVLDYSKKVDWFGFVGWGLVGFGILFFMAFIARLISLVKLSKQYEPKLIIHKKDYFSLWQFLKRARETPFGRFSIYAAVFRIAVNIAGPFWAVYMLRDLGFSYILFMIITVAGTLFQLFFYPFAGKFSDRLGNVLLLKVATFFMIATPFLWILSAYLNLSPTGLIIYLVLVPSLVGGFSWAGFNLAINNYIYDSVRQEKRSYGIIYFNFLSGLGLFIGAGIGSLLALLNIQFMNLMLFIFGVSAIARIFVFILGRKCLREVRHVKRFTKQFVIHEFRPVEGVIREIHHLNNIGGNLIHKV